MTVLSVETLSKAYGGLRALDDVSFALEQGKITSLIGPNGAGKTTCLNVIAGVYAADAGRVYLRGRDITGCLPYEAAALGLARTFQHPRLFADMSALDNVLAGAFRSIRAGYLAMALRLPFACREQEAAERLAAATLERVGLAALAGQRAGDLSTGNQRLLELARALATRPQLLLLDEPAAGLNDTETELFARLVVSLRDEGLSVLLVEHNMDVVMNISDAVVVLNHGQTIAAGSPAHIQKDATVIEAYLGSSAIFGQAQ